MTSLTEQQNSGIVFVKSLFVRGKASCPFQRIFVVYFPITDATEVSIGNEAVKHITDYFSKVS